MSKKVSESDIPRSAEDVISGNSPPRRRSFFSGHSGNDVSEKITKLAIVQELRIMDEKIDKLTSYLDALVNQNHTVVIGPITRTIAEHTQLILNQIQRKVFIPEETALALRVAGSILKDEQEKQTRKNKCQTKKKYEMREPKENLHWINYSAKKQLECLIQIKELLGQILRGQMIDNISKTPAPTPEYPAPHIYAREHAQRVTQDDIPF